MKQQIKAPEQTQLSDGTIANLSEAEFKILVIRKLIELVEFGRKLDEKMKAMLSEIKENSDRKETGTQINGVDQKEETFNQKRMKKQEFKNMRRSSGTSGITLNTPTSES